MAWQRDVFVLSVGTALGLFLGRDQRKLPKEPKAKALPRTVSKADLLAVPMMGEPELDEVWLGDRLVAEIYSHAGRYSALVYGPGGNLSERQDSGLVSAMFNTADKALEFIARVLSGQDVVS